MARGGHRLLWLLLFLGSCGESDVSKLPSPMLFAPPLDEDVSIEDFEPVSSVWGDERERPYALRPPDSPIARVVWRNGIEERMKLFRTMQDTEGEAVRLRAMGMQDVSIERFGEDDGFAGVTARL